MSTVLRYGMFSAAESAKHIINGDFDCSPAKFGKIDACAFCNFKSVCGFNENEPGYAPRNLSKLGSRDEVINLMKQALGEEEDSSKDKGDI